MRHFNFWLYLLVALVSAVGALTITLKNSVDMNGNQIIGLPSPTADSDLATKKYVDDSAGGGGSGTSVFLPGTSAAASEAGYIKIVNLNDGAQMDDLERFRSVEAVSPHVGTLGILPQDFVIISRDDTLVIHNIRSNADYVKFQGGSNNAIPAACDLRDIDFLDGFVFATCHSAGGGVIRIDFATGEIMRWTESQELRYGDTRREGILQRNSAANYREICQGGDCDWGALKDDEAFAVAANRYWLPHQLDIAGRRKHFITVGGQAGNSIMSPADTTVKGFNLATPTEAVEVTERGHLFLAGDNGVEVDIRFHQQVHGLQRSVTALDADEIWDNDATQALKLQVTDAATFGGFAIADSRQYPRMVIGTSEAAIIIDYVNQTGLEEERQHHIHQKIEDDKNYPPYFGSEVNIYAFEAALPEDGGDDGDDLTGSTGTPTYSAGVVGNAVHFDGSSRLSITGRDFSTDAGFVFAFWCSTATTAATQQHVIFWGSAAATLVYIQTVATTGVTTFVIDNGAAGDDRITYGGDAGETPPFGTSASPDPGWHHLAGTRDQSTTGFYRLYIDGVQVDSTAISNITGSISPTELYVGSNRADTEPMTGAIDELVYIANIEYPPEWYIKRLYYRGLVGRNVTVDPTDAMDAQAIVAVAAHGNNVVLATADSATVINKLGLPIARYGTVSGTINDVDLSHNYNGLPVVAIGATTSFSITVNPTDTAFVQGLVTHNPKSNVNSDIRNNPCVIDSSGVRGLWWDIEVDTRGPFIACQRGNRHHVQAMAGTYTGDVIIDIDNIHFSGRGIQTKFRNLNSSETEDHFIVTADNSYIENMTIGTIGDQQGNTGTSDAVRIEGLAGERITFENVHIIEADRNGIEVKNAPKTALINTSFGDVDERFVLVSGLGSQSPHSYILNLRGPVLDGGANRGAGISIGNDSLIVIGGFIGGESTSTLGSLILDSGSQDNNIIGVSAMFELTDNGTSNSVAANQSNP